jgi:hypothetical protein
LVKLSQNVYKPKILQKENNMESIFIGLESKQFQLIGINKFVKWEDNFDKILKESEDELQNKLHLLKSVVDPPKRINYFYGYLLDAGYVNARLSYHK